MGVIPRKPCITFIARLIELGTPCKHCANLATVHAECWVDVTYRQELEARGINSEYAARLAMASSIRHQSKPDSQPFETVSLCRTHWLNTCKIALLYDKVTPQLQELYARLTPSQRMILFDKNRSDSVNEPTVTVGEYTDIHHFLEVVTKLMEEGEL